VPSKVQIKLASEDWVDAYTFDINPLEFTGNDETEVNQKRTIDGRSIEQYSQHDGITRIMIWKNLPNRDPYKSQIATLRTYLRAGVCAIRLRDLTATDNQTIADYIRVVAIDTKFRPGGGSENSTGNLTYETVQLKYVLTKAP